MKIKNYIRRSIIFFSKKIFGIKSNIVRILEDDSLDNLFYNRNIVGNAIISEKSKLYPKYTVLDSSIDDYTYIAQNATIRLTKIGKYCSIGANFVCGWGIHPTKGISTSPMFYSTQKQNGTSLCSSDKIKETLPITIGNDVFIGMNVTILDGVTIGDGAVIGAGSIVSKNIPPYAIAVGSPIRIIKYRFEESTIDNLLGIKWWNWSEEDIKKVEKHFFDVEEFVRQNTTNEAINNNNQL